MFVYKDCGLHTCAEHVNWQRKQTAQVNNLHGRRVELLKTMFTLTSRIQTGCPRFRSSPETTGTSQCQKQKPQFIQNVLNNSNER